MKTAFAGRFQDFRPSPRKRNSAICHSPIRS